ncbi:hypothetical protein K439DRAFT_320406 [Ramaria rubella]|nr:hypothetical protein K439DRAFT_320406 [Ramaria rubella]
MPRFNFTFQEASPLIVYTGFWTEGNPANDSLYSDYSGSFRVTNSTDATATLNFNATGISLFGALRPNHGNYSVNLDHNAVDSASGNGNNIFKASLWEAYGLSYEPHVVDLINIPSGSGPYLDLDFVQIERQIGDDGGTIHQNTLDDTSIFVHYSTGPWQSFSESNGTTHQSISPNSQFSIAFQGCCIELYGLYANADYEVSLDGQAPVPMHGMDVTLDPSMWHPNTLLYMMDGLPQNINHTVDLNTLGSTSQDRPFYFDYAIVRSTHER